MDFLPSHLKETHQMFSFNCWIVDFWLVHGHIFWVESNCSKTKWKWKSPVLIRLLLLLRLPRFLSSLLPWFKTTAGRSYFLVLLQHPGCWLDPGFFMLRLKPDVWRSNCTRSRARTLTSDPGLEPKSQPSLDSGRSSMLITRRLVIPALGHLCPPEGPRWPMRPREKWGSGSPAPTAGGRWRTTWSRPAANIRRPWRGRWCPGWPAGRTQPSSSWKVTRETTEFFKRQNRWWLAGNTVVPLQGCRQGSSNQALRRQHLLWIPLLNRKHSPLLEPLSVAQI